MKYLNRNRMLAVYVTAAAVSLGLLVTTSKAQEIQNLTNGLVAYWPMDNTNAFGEIPDLVSSYNLRMYFKDKTPTNRWAEDTLYLTNDAVRGNAVYWPFYTGTPPRVTLGNNTNATGFFLAYLASPNDKLPISRWTPTNWTIAMWVKLGDNHPYQDADQRIWCEGNRSDNFPTLNTSVTGPGEIRIFERGLLGQGNRVNNNVRIYNDEQTNTWTGGNGWRLLTMVQRQDEGQTGTAANRYLFVDGYLVAGPGTGQAIIGKLDGIINNLDNFSLGGWYRASVPDVAFLTNGIIDEVAIWERALTTNEIWFYMTNSIGVTLPGATPPLRITSFKADLALQMPGEANVLRWQVSPDVTKVEIDQGVGDVTANTVNGVGSVSIAPTETLTYKLTIRRGVETKTETTLVKVVGYPASGWKIIDGFDQLVPSPLLNQNNWESVIGGIWGGTHVPIRVWSAIDGNKFISPDGAFGADGAPVLSGNWLKLRSIPIGQSNTLFFRFYIDPAINQYYSEIPGYPVVDILVGLADDKGGGLRASAEYYLNNNGPSIRILRENYDQGGPIDLQANWGPWNNLGGTNILAEIAPTGLTAGVVYNVWIDAFRTNAGENISSFYSVRIQQEGGPVITWFTDMPSDRTAEGAAEKPFDHVFIAARNVNPQYTNMVRFDDFYLSESGYRTDVPVPARSMVTGSPTLPPNIQIASVRRVTAGIELRWNSVPGAYYTVERRSAVVGGGWLPVAVGVPSGGTTTTWVDTNPPAGSAYYRVISP